MVKRGIMGAWVLVGALWLTQYGAVEAEEQPTRLAAGPSQGTIPTPGDRPIDVDQRAGNGGTDRPIDLDQRATSGGGGGGGIPTYRHPLDSPGGTPRAQTGGGGGGGGAPAVTPALRGNPDGVDAVPEQPGEGGGGGGAAQPVWVNPFFMVVPDGSMVPAPAASSP